MHTDIAIIGGGIGGLYTGYQLEKSRIQNWTLYNADNRFGGKIHSNIYTDEQGKRLFCEWGAMRFEWGCQPYLEQLIEELCVDLIEFPPFCGDRGWELDLIEEICSGIWHCFFQYYNISYDGDIWRFLFYKENYARFFVQLGEADWLPYAQQFVRPQDVYLIDWLNDYSPTWKTQLEKAQKSVRAFLGLEFNVLHWVSRWTKVLMANNQIKTCEHGNESIIDELVLRLPQENMIQDAQLVRLEYDERKAEYPYELWFKNGRIDRANKVVLALPPRHLLQLDYDFPQSVDNILTSLHGFELGRVFVRIKNPWWPKDSFFAMQNENADALFAREVYYYTLSEDEGVIMIYFGKHFMSYWRQFKTDEQIMGELARLLKIGRDRIVDVRYKFWDGQSHVFAFQYLANGYAPHDVMRQFSRLNNNTLAILGDSFSFDAGFIEGVLTSSHYFLREFLKNEFSTNSKGMALTA